MSLFLYRLITAYNSISNKDYFYVELLLITITKTTEAAIKGIK